ncbi:hypothetical protein DL89DRAFT_131964 [Linderina pennispora]|uniref:Uncharacterized protein n=1 Tax=Linderina pennispora TaxID=61395 RepID=A0A1Y1VV40_9FUNG|nr:uncharacterized protein DL89DRAFT_131964 [Linderina pennispora]ORX65147.1 hypothetical protein DL89DRAFT_131964 [Linderina pennispora]
MRFCEILDLLLSSKRELQKALIFLHPSLPSFLSTIFIFISPLLKACSPFNVQQPKAFHQQKQPYGAPAVSQRAAIERKQPIHTVDARLEAGSIANTRGRRARATHAPTPTVLDGQEAVRNGSIQFSAADGEAAGTGRGAHPDNWVSDIHTHAKDAHSEQRRSTGATHGNQRQHKVQSVTGGRYTQQTAGVPCPGNQYA